MHQGLLVQVLIVIWVAFMSYNKNHYQYLDTSETADTLNDIRFYNNAGTLTFQKCTVANATKGAGTWTTIGTM